MGTLMDIYIALFSLKEEQKGELVVLLWCCNRSDLVTQHELWYVVNQKLAEVHKEALPKCSPRAWSTIAQS